MAGIKIGDRAAGFCLPDAENTEHCLGDYRNKWVVLYFYPRDNTSGCTREARDFSALKLRFKRAGAGIIGVSKDSPKSHGRFIERQGLGILLLSDEEHKVIEQYGAWGKKKLYGKEHEGTIRSTFLIDPNGRVRKIWKKVKVAGHAEEVLETLRSEKKA